MEINCEVGQNAEIYEGRVLGGGMQEVGGNHFLPPHPLSHPGSALTSSVDGEQLCSLRSEIREFTCQLRESPSREEHFEDV